ncbi:alpha-hydroxy-acid oxidizing protein [Thalassococcus sp. S3]|uniref:alpha-hydroxy-acid oxidizing protein n=1 Tax=Thalassococcus sp. S3 TaxID=2017482 RepID=UPI0013EEE916
MRSRRPSGEDILKAQAPAADSVPTGRDILYGFGGTGQVGAAHVIHPLKTELERPMALPGTRSMLDITPDHVRDREAVRAYIP